MLLSAVLFVATLYSATAVYPGLVYYCYFVSCPIPSCANPLPAIPKYGQCCPRCPIDCRAVLCPAPSCPNPIPPGPGECCSKCIGGQTCSIRGQVFQQCKSCPITCANRNQQIACPLICRPGCGCPPGTVIDEINQRCVRPERCPSTPTCPIRGQVFQQCRTCPATCREPSIACIALCQPGCGCPPRQLIDVQNNKCVARDQCPSNNRNKCNLPRVTGPCLAYIPRYFYNANTQRCERFIYGGCRGNDNNFRTLQDCQRECSISSNPTCKLPRDPGPCQAAIIRYFYNTNTRRCERFLYGGCRGNRNNFESLNDCEARCKTNSTNPRLPYRYIG